jgi:hypothetical protein
VLAYLGSIGLFYDCVSSLSADIAMQSNRLFSLEVNVATVMCKSLYTCKKTGLHWQSCQSEVALLVMLLCFFLAFFK